MNVEPVTNLGPIVGGVVGALADLVIVVLIIVFVRRRRRRYVESLHGNVRTRVVRVEEEKREIKKLLKVKEKYQVSSFFKLFNPLKGIEKLRVLYNGKSMYPNSIYNIVCKFPIFICSLSFSLFFSLPH